MALAALFVLALLAAGCGDSSDETTSAAADESGVVFGRGSVPDTVPESFPIPEQAVVGATLVDTNRGLTEMILTFPASVDAVATYYDENLPVREYEVSSSNGTNAEWEIDFSGEGVEGEIRLKTGGGGLSSATVRFVDR